MYLDLFQAHVAPETYPLEFLQIESKIFLHFNKEHLRFFFIFFRCFH